MQINPFFADVDASSHLDTLVHLGAGRCSELEAHLALQPQRLLLVEADPQLAEALGARTADLPQVQVACAAVAGTPGSVVFYRYNLPDAGSLHPAGGLLQLFPGLKLLESLPMDAISPVPLLQPLQLQAEQENLLIIDLPGEELPVLRALLQAKQLHLFRRVQLYGGREPLYEGCEPAQLVLRWLQEQGFDLLAEDSSQDPDRPCWTMQCNPSQLRCQELQNQLGPLSKARDEQAKLASERQVQIEQLTKARDEQTKLASERQVQIEQLSEARDGAAKLAEERQVQLETAAKEKAQLVEARDQQIKQATDKQAQLEQITKARDEQRKLVAERQVQIDQLSEARDEAAKLADERRAQLETAAKEKAQLVEARDQQAKVIAEKQSQVDPLTKARDEQTKLALERQSEIAKLITSLQEADSRRSQLESQLAEREQRQQLMNDELVRAEGQIDLIKDLLLRETDCKGL